MERRLAGATEAWPHRQLGVPSCPEPQVRLRGAGAELGHWPQRRSLDMLYAPYRPFCAHLILPEGALPRPDDEVRVEGHDLLFGRVPTVRRRGHWNRLV